jgi:hypothetical protein
VALQSSECCGAAEWLQSDEAATACCGAAEWLQSAVAATEWLQSAVAATAWLQSAVVAAALQRAMALQSGYRVLWLLLRYSVLWRCRVATECCGFCCAAEWLQSAEAATAWLQRSEAPQSAMALQSS